MLRKLKRDTIIYQKIYPEKEVFYGGKKTNAILLKIGPDNQIESLKEYLRKKKIYVRSGFKIQLKIILE